MKNIFIPLILFTGIGITATAQESNSGSTEKTYSNNTTDKVIYSRKEVKGDKYTFNYSYDKAIDSYNHSKNLSVVGQRKLAEGYHLTDQNIQSEAVYLKIINAQNGVLPEDYYNYAMVLKINGKYNESNKWMDKFSNMKPDDLRAKDYMANKDKFTGLLIDNGKYKIEHLIINSDADDFGTSYFKNQIVFASTKSNAKMIVKKYNWTGKPFWDMYVSDVDKSQLKTPKNFSKKMNGKLHDGPASFSNNGSFMAFTRNNYETKKKDKVVNLQIFFSNYKDGEWTKPESFILNNMDYSVGQPCLTADGNTMYFTSDMPGGFGGADIYKITKDAKGVWGKPENLGNKINTEGDEMFPFIEEKNNLLLFTSNGHFGLGGLDIFVCAMNGSEFGPVVNAGYPLNTQYDDFAAIVNDSMTSGYFSSNRDGGSGGDDIYSYELLNGFNIGKKIIGIAEDKNKNPIPKTFIKLLDHYGNLSDTMTTNNDGAFSFFVSADKNFQLIGEKKKYNDGDTTANTFCKEYIVKADVILLLKDTIIQKKAEVVADLGKILNLNPIYFDLDKYNIRSDAAIELDKVVKIMNDNPDLIVELSSYTDCRESVEYNQTLSDERSIASIAYIKKRITTPERIFGKGYGKSNLVNGCTCNDNVGANCSEVEHQQNRRTEFKIVKK